MGIPRVVIDGVDKILYVHKHSLLRIIEDPIIESTMSVPGITSNNQLSTIYSIGSVWTLVEKRRFTVKRLPRLGAER